jgi:hypothetical protein
MKTVKSVVFDSEELASIIYTYLAKKEKLKAGDIRFDVYVDECGMTSNITATVEIID